MPSLDSLSAASGQWTGTNTLHNPNTGQPETTESTIRVESVLGGRFHRLAYIWSCQGKPQEGELLIGGDGELVTGAWVDTWHQGKTIFSCTGSAPSEGRIELRGTFPAPPGPDWGWTIDLDVAAARIAITMNCHTPEGESVPAVEASWTRPGPAAARAT
ncbi:MAG: DUF1579 family protein [Cytophagaceae bacterium]|nr:DUF1579 family protein [Gemmatimonadaceae bacterium]